MLQRINTKGLFTVIVIPMCLAKIVWNFAEIQSLEKSFLNCGQVMFHS